MTQFPKQVKIVEVGPRDGLQNEKTILPSNIKIAFIDQLSQTGLTHIEVTSFVSPKWIPQLADHDEVLKKIQKNKNICYSALIPNLQGLEAALSLGIQHIAVFTTPSEQFSERNTHCSVAESLDRIEQVMAVAKKNHLTIRGYLSCVLGCPYEGEMAAAKVADLAEKLLQMGCDEISLGDTIGRGTPLQVKALLDTVLSSLPVNKIGVHFHDTFGQAMANIYTALEYGISIIDGAVAGLGGCPYAKGASGNAATEDIIYLLNGMGIETGVNLEKLARVGRFITEQLGKKPLSKTNLAITEG